MRAFLVGVVGLAAAGCGDPLVVSCTSDAMCTRNGTQGSCRPSTASSHSFCAFSDGACPGGLRWDPTAGDSLAGTCATGGNNGGDGFVNNKDGGPPNPDMAPNNTWVARTSGVTDWLFTVWGTGPNNVYVGGQITKAILHSSDGGMTWIKQFLPVDQEVNSIWGLSATEIWAGSDSGLFFHSTDGSTWTMLQTAGTDDWSALWGTGSDLWAGTAAGGMWHYKVGGTWTQQTLPMACQNAVHGVIGTDNMHVTMVGYNGTYCATVDGGANWLPLNNTGDTKNLGGIWMTPDGVNVFLASEAGTVYRSTDKGGNWKTDTTPITDDLFGAFGSSASDVYAIGGNPNAAIIHWNGTMWTQQMSPVNNGLSGIWASSPTDYYAVGLNGTILHGPPQ